MSANETRIQTSKNIAWTPRPGWATVRLVGTCADRSLRRGQVVQHSPSEEYSLPGQNQELGPGTTIIVLSEAAHLVEDDLHLVPEIAVVAVGQPLP
jgi:hypothetical protein